eukprot:2140127-Prorocentrum_lima.AAC.1
MPQKETKTGRTFDMDIGRSKCGGADMDIGKPISGWFDFEALDDEEEKRVCITTGECDKLGLQRETPCEKWKEWPR